MTLIIGARCKDGVIIAGDRRVLRGTERSEEKKIIQAFPNFVVGASGISGLMDKFLYEIKQYIDAPRKEGEELTWRVFSYFLEDLANSLFQKYSSRLEQLQQAEMGAFAFDALYGVKEYTDHASLYHMYGNGFSVEVKKFDIVGHGQPHALPFLKTIYHSGISMGEMIKLCVFVLKLIDEEDIDLSVGGRPQIYKIPDIGDAVEVSEEEITELLKNAKTKKLKELIFS
jgi:20S proteasome alpha/beta subunit